jgi:hypothetical protein
MDAVDQLRQTLLRVRFSQYLKAFLTERVVVRFVHLMSSLNSKHILLRKHHALLEDLLRMYLFPSDLQSAILNQRYEKVPFLYFLKVNINSKVLDRMRGEHFPNGCCLDAIAGDAIQKITNFDDHYLGSDDLVLHSDVLQRLSK